MPSPNRVRQNAHMGRLLKRRGNEQKPTNSAQPLDWRWLMANCRPWESPRSTLIVTNVEANESDIPGMMTLQAEIDYREGGIWDQDEDGYSFAKAAYKAIPFDFLIDAVIKLIRD
jgi:hypothetical protein